jgi:hypothetical protein
MCVAALPDAHQHENPNNNIGNSKGRFEKTRGHSGKQIGECPPQLPLRERLEQDRVRRVEIRGSDEVGVSCASDEKHLHREIGLQQSGECHAVVQAHAVEIEECEIGRVPGAEREGICAVGRMADFAAEIAKHRTDAFGDDWLIFEQQGDWSVSHSCESQWPGSERTNFFREAKQISSQCSFSGVPTRRAAANKSRAI